MKNQTLTAIAVCGCFVCFAFGQQTNEALTPAAQEKLRTANALGEEYVKLFQKGKIAEAIDPARRSLALLESVFGPDDPNIVDALDNLSGFYKLTGRFVDALPLRKRIVMILEKQLGSHHPATIQKLNNLATLYVELGNFAEAEIIFRRAIAGYEKAYGADHPELAISLCNLALACDSQAKYKEAEELYDRAIRIQEKAFGANDVRVAVSVNNLAGLYEMIGDLSKAAAGHRRALKIRETSLSPTDPVVAESLMNLGVVCARQEKFQEALLLHERALRICETTLGPKHRRTSTALNNLALTHQAMGNMPQALALLERASQVTEAAFGEVHPNTATSLNNLAAVNAQMGNGVAAVALYRRSLQIREKVSGRNHPETASALHNLADALSRQGDPKTAEQYYCEALEISEAVSGPNHPDTGAMLNSLANFQNSVGKAAEAEILLLRALRISEETRGKEHSATARAWNDLGLVYRNQGKDSKAEGAFRKAVEIDEKVLGPEHPTTIGTLQNFVLLQAERDRASAMESTDVIRRRTRQHVARILPFLSESEQLAYLSKNYNKGLHYALSLGLTDSGNTQLAEYSANWLANGKAVAQDALAQRNLANRSITDANREKYDQLQQVRKQLATLAMAGSEADQRNERRLLMEQLTSDERRLSREFGSDSDADIGVDSNAWVTSQQIRTALAAESVLIDIARVGLYNFNTKFGEHFWQPDRYAAWITPHDPAIKAVCIDLGPASEIDELVEAVRIGIQNAGSATGPVHLKGEEAATGEMMAELKALSEKILQPLIAHLNGVREIVLSPDSTLWLAPWTALPVAEDEHLIERYSLRFVISGRDVVTERRKFPANPPVIIANPLFDQKASDKRISIEAIFKTLPAADELTTRSFSARSLLPNAPALPNTAIEAMAIQPNLEQYAGDKATLYKERYALERIAKALRSPKVVSFATHGFFLPTQPVPLEESSGSTTDQNLRSTAKDGSSTAFENPLLRCGLLLSGCNNREASVADDDGILTGMEIVSIDFRGTELVVLSACETGIGDVRNGEGVAGLRQAFQLAGAQAVVSTLWQVPDRDSALLMSKFFEELADGKSKSEALRNAQLERIQKRRERYGSAHPFFWAAFTLTGS
ncbi:MAG: CHAT domain-containing tetratricopeptide repeat protein [Planctomycetaceae bacterium]